MSDFKHVGTVEILRMRVYNLDPYNEAPMATEVVVMPGHCPLLYDGYSHLWTMSGKLNGQFLRRGDGLFLVNKGANAMPTNIDVIVPSRLFSPDDWQELLNHETCQEGHPEQRLRITILKETA